MIAAGTSTVVNLDTGADEIIQSHYLAACRAGHSGIPGAVGAERGDASILDHALNSFVRAPALWEPHDKGEAALAFFVDVAGL